MVRAKRHYIPGQIRHITHRCHKREFLLKFSKDRQRWLQWLLEAKSGIDRDDKWICSVAVGSERFITDMKESMGGMVLGRKTSASEKSYQLREAQASYSALFGA